VLLRQVVHVVISVYRNLTYNRFWLQKLGPRSDLLLIRSSCERLQFVCGVFSDFLSKSIHAVVNWWIIVSNYMKTARKKVAVFVLRIYCFIFRDVPKEIRNIFKQLFISRDSIWAIQVRCVAAWDKAIGKFASLRFLLCPSVAVCLRFVNYCNVVDIVGCLTCICVWF
jgi:hypothetical protein